MDSMNMVLLLKAALMGVVEGLTEFLPISSTGHLILAGALLDFADERAKVFEIAIQTGAIFAVILVYWQRLKATFIALPTKPVAQRFAVNVIVAFLPAVVLGLVFGRVIKTYLFTPQVVASTFIVGGLIILWVEQRVAAGQATTGGTGRERAVRVVRTDVDQLTWRDALKVGLMQCLAMVPGTSRSGATIIGGMWLGLSRKCATEFSFYLAIPTLIGAGVYSLYKERALLKASDLGLFAVGLVFAFVSAWLCVRWLLRMVSTHSFVAFAWYRIAFGLIVLGTWAMGWVHWRAG